MSKPHYYVTTAIEYVNSTPHVGHSYEKIGADVIARTMRLRGYDVVFQMGTDEHSTQVARKAAEFGKPTQQFCDEMVDKFLAVWKKLNLSFDVFIRTTSQRHIDTVREILRRIHEADDIYKGTYTGNYCPSCERFYPEKELLQSDKGLLCPTHNIACDWLEEENYFFKLSKYRDPLLQHIRENPDFILPAKRRNEIVNVLEEGLEDVSISRSKAEWGVPLPWDEDAVTYVWFDALINYLSAVGFSDEPETFEKFWPAQLQIIGKDITRFHCIIWPSMLMAAGLALPRTVHGHGFVHFEGRKMSKTDGTVVDPLEVVDIYGADSLRYYLMSEVQWGNDGDFAWQRFFERYNADLANNLGNMVNRCLTMIKRYSDGPVAIPDNPSSGADLAFDTSLLKEYLNAIDEIRLHDVSKALISMVDGVNLYIDKTQPWVMAKDESKREELEAVLYNLAESLRWITLCAWPIVPESAEKIWSQMNMPGQLADNNIESLSWGEFPANITVNKPKPVFPRIEQQES